ncbi:MAG: helix-turn-helix transcriptional regulator [Arcobacteraceae bacterium]
MNNEYNIKIENVEDRLLKIEDVIKYIPVSKQQWYVLIKQNIAPKPIKFGASSFWRWSDIQKMISQQSAAS